VIVGPRTFRVLANTVIDTRGERLGTSVDWADLTLEKEGQLARENERIRSALDTVH
jgi:methyl-accepting chemotaxis protein